MTSKEKWNQRYQTTEYIYGKSPNQFFKNFLMRHSPGKLLLPCEGEGRNAVYAAKQGWEVTAFDQSDVGMKKAVELAKEAQIKLEYHLSDALDFNYQSESFDVIAFLWAHFPPEIRRKVHQKSIQGLKPGGYLILEGFSKKQLVFTSGGPKDPEMLFAQENFAEDFPGVVTLQLEETQAFIEESTFHQGEAWVIRFVGMKM